MKKILGLDLGTTSIGWAYIKEPENEVVGSEIVNLGVRIVPISSDEESDFAKGNKISINADRTLKRGARRNLQRYKLRRNALLSIFSENKWVPSSFYAAEQGAASTFSTLKLRAEAAAKRIELEDLAKVLLQINKKRGYKSSRKAKSEEDEGVAIDSMGIAKELYDSGSTPGQWTYQSLQKGRKNIPDFYRSDLQDEFTKIVAFQAAYNPDLFTKEFEETWMGRPSTQIKQFFNSKGIQLVENKGKREERKIQEYQWRSLALTSQVDLQILAFILSQINSQITNSSGYLGAISDRSKELYFRKLTVGQYLHAQIQKDPHFRLKGQVFYRQDYLDEFEQVWNTQAAFHPQLTDSLKKEIRDVVIFYQRRLKSQKHLISTCEFETTHKVAPKSHPVFQEFRIWQNLNNLSFNKKDNPNEKFYLELEHKKDLAKELAFRRDYAAADVIKRLAKKPSEWELNFDKIEGNRTNHAIFEAFAKLIELEDGEPIELDAMNSDDILDQFSEAFLRLGINTDLLQINFELEGDAFEQQAYVQFWHLLYSSEDEASLKKILVKKFGFKPEHTKILVNISLQEDHASLSNRALKKIVPHLQSGLHYDEACSYAGYNHSSSLTKEANEARELKSKLDLVKKNSLRNPVVEKILNQMVNVVNAILEDERMGRPDEIRVEMARDLKATAKERKLMTASIAKSTQEHEKIKLLLKSEFGIQRVTRNDIIRYKLWKETSGISVYTGKPIEASKLFSKEYDIEHIIPKAKLFDDSFSNKVLCESLLNREKGNLTAYSFLQKKFSPEEFEQYLQRVKSLFGTLGRAKIQKLLTADDKIPEDFIARQLQETRYITKKAKELLFEVTRKVNVTTGSITDRLREDWGLIDVLQELNWDKYYKLGLTYTEEGKHGNPIRKIKDWTKRNDHRHHAMDALTVSLTRPAHVHYLNNLNARGSTDKKGAEIYGIEQKYLTREDGKYRFIAPIANIREEAKQHLESILVSYKAKNKVVTTTKNKLKKKGGLHIQEVLTPRGQLHKETVYGKSMTYVTALEKVGSAFTEEKINTIANKQEREALLARLKAHNSDPVAAFTGKNALSKLPIYISLEKNIRVPEKVKTVVLESNFTIRKEIGPDLKLDKVVDQGIKKILEQRLADFGGNAKLAFSNLDEQPIWQNKEKGIAIKRVKISGVSNVEALHAKRDHLGQLILDSQGRPIPTDYISTGNNHHVALYRDEEGNLQDEVVTFFEAVTRRNQGLPVIKYRHEKGWEFLFTIKQNEYFVFPSADFNPKEMDLQNPQNLSIISKNLFRAQKIAPRYYVFRHHLETTLNDSEELKDIAFKRIQSLPHLVGIIKVRINHIGQIIQIGEF